MDINSLIIWIICLSSGTLFFRAIQASYRNNKGWIGVCAIVLGVTLGLTGIDAAIAAKVGGLLWVTLLMIPSLGFSRVNRYVSQQRYDKAHQLANYLCWLHPTDGWWEYSYLLEALAIAQRGDTSQAIQRLKAYQQKYPRLTYQAQGVIYRLQANWANYLNWLTQSVPSERLLQEPMLMVDYLRALGETGNIGGLFAQFPVIEKRLMTLGDTQKVNYAKLLALAFCGQIAEVKKLFQGGLSMYSLTVQEFWIATAQMVAGKKGIAQQELSILLNSEDGAIVNAVNWRLSHSLGEPALLLNSLAQEQLMLIKTEVSQDHQYSLSPSIQSSQPIITYGLIGLNLAFFFLEIQRGGSTNENTLYSLGALVPQVVFGQGQWWRIISANFLHYGWLHLTTNMLGLYFLGNFIERNLGKIRYLVIYLLSGFSTMFFYSWLVIHFNQPEQLLVGASAAIMGLVGAIFILFFRDWLKTKSRITTKRLQMVTLVICLQFAFDFNIPQVSFLSHLLGMIFGMIFGSLVIFSKKT